MYGAVIGDIIGSTYEHHNVKKDVQIEQIELFSAEILSRGKMLLDSGLKRVINEFCEKYGIDYS